MKKDKDDHAFDVDPGKRRLNKFKMLLSRRTCYLHLTITHYTLTRPWQASGQVTPAP